MVGVMEKTGVRVERCFEECKKKVVILEDVLEGEVSLELAGRSSHL